ncbi:MULTISPECIES: hypothetical protein [Paenibacillus]|uniref:Uncharacterized protein n=1 Tax=Paenibacillus albilobatus TaxID=2716884 RepID=A0A919XF89_9BACL|nr:MULTISPECIES: hypothetical protein [Paenibacillus]GIO29880.1 hypothetical protein J2TS6_10210 [Paenibacillus albilobatus]
MGFLHLFWGFLFLIDIRINDFDILPDVIGYLLFFLGFVKLEHRSGHFRSAKNVSVVLLILSVVTLILSLSPPRSWLFIFLFNAVLVVLKLYMVFHTCYGISEWAGRRGHRAFQNKAVQRWGWYFGVVAATFIVLLIAPLVPPLAVLLAIVLMVASLFAHVMMMLLVQEAEHVLRR